MSDDLPGDHQRKQGQRQPHCPQAAGEQAPIEKPEAAWAVDVIVHGQHVGQRPLAEG